MARILHSDAAPAESVHYTFAGVEFDLDGAGASYETSDAAALSVAEGHPWLTVERDEAEVVQGAYVEQVSAEDDALSAQNSVANDPEAARAAEADKAEKHADPTAIDAGENQTAVVETGSVNETFAAEDNDETDTRDF